MNFFDLQARARRRTWALLGWMLLAVVLITLAMNAAAYGIALLAGVFHPTLAPDGSVAFTGRAGIERWLSQPWWQYVTAGTLAALFGGSLYRYLQVAKGGRAFADMVDARRVDLSTREEADRRFINVVEEMSIASGTPRPALYVMEQESGINAFVAGVKPTDAIMVVTRGALEQLSRDELQGVVGHEFSHILNGDMRLNLRLMAIVAGILMFGKVGQFMLRGTRGSHRHHGSRRRRGGVMRGDGRLMAAWYATGLALLVIGYVGLLCGRLIKAAVSRQREFLADASAVQFTRSTDGISGALWRISKAQQGSLMSSAYAEDMSHMCFGQSIATRFGNAFATHPPIERRLVALDPQFRARRVARRVRERQRDTAPESAPAEAGSTQAGSPGAAGLAAAGLAAGALSARAVADSVGRPTPEHTDYARRLHARLPAEVLDAAHQGSGAEALVYALLLGDLDPVRAPVARALISHQADATTATRAAALHALLAPLGDAARLPVLELAVATLRDGDPALRERVTEAADRLARLDRRLSLFEFSLLALLRHHLRSDDDRDRTRFFSFAPVTGDLRRLLSLLARAGNDDEAAAAAAFERAAASFAGGDLRLAPAADCEPLRMGDALARIALLSPLLKRPVIEACVDCVQHDGRVTVTEAELLRAVSECLDCPMPPLLPGA